MRFTSMIAQSVNSLDLHKSISLLVELQFTICRDDEDTAERLREGMEVPLRSLTWNEREWIRGVSGDLESVCGQEDFEPNPYSEPEYKKCFLDAWVRVETEPEAILSLLRVKQSILTPAQTAYARARTYGILGFHTLYTAFMRLASHLEPSVIAYKIFLLNALNEPENYDERKKIVDDILETEAAAPNLFIVAAANAFMLTRDLPPDIYRPRLGWLRGRLQRFFSRHPTATLHSRDAILGLHTLGSIQERLNRHNAAQEIYREAYKLDPSNEPIAIAFATSLLRNNEVAAQKIFSDLAARNTSHGIAYLFAAQSAARQGLYEECIRLSETALEKTNQPILRAEAYKFLALCELEMNGPTDRVQACFEQAVKAEPSIISIQEAFETFREIRRNFALVQSPRKNYGPTVLMEHINFNLTPADISTNTMMETLSGYSKGLATNLNAVAA